MKGLINVFAVCVFWLFKIVLASVRVIFDKKLYRELLFLNKITILDTNFNPKKVKIHSN